MTIFLRLSKTIINTRYIQNIDIYPTQYTITLATNHNFSGWTVGWLGFVSSKNQDTLYFFKNSEDQEDKDDYILVDKWIKSLDSKHEEI
jgi:hypothetical protein